MSISTNASFGLASRATCASAFCTFALVACAPYRRGYFGVGAGSVQQLVDLLGLRSEALLVVGFAAQSGDRDVKGGARASDADSTQAARQPSRASLHTTPHLLRSTHSVQHSSNTRKNTIGMSHRSFVSRTVMPASE